MFPPDIEHTSYYFPLKRPVTVTMIVLTCLVFGVLSYRLLHINILPDISYPSLTVRTEYPGAAPEEVENTVTRPLEQGLGIVRNLVEISSSSRAELSDILLEFDWGTDMNAATQDVREKLDVVFLADDVKKPLILRYDPSLDPMMRIGFVSDSLDLMELRTLVEDVVKRELDKIPGVAAVKIKGGEEVEIKIELDAVKLDLFNLSVDQVQNRLASENVNLAGGRLLEGETEFIVRTLNEFKTVEELANIVVAQNLARNIKLNEIASVKRTSGEPTTITRVAGLESVEIEIHKESDANPIAVSEIVKKRLFGEPLKKQFSFIKNKELTELLKGPKPLAEMLTDRIQVSILSDQADFIRTSVDNVKSAAVWGGVLAILVLLLFLGKLKDTLVAAAVIPVSIVSAFAAMHLSGVTLNIMSLGGLALGIGMMVDNSIVVIESIYRRREEGDNSIEAAVRGTSVVGGAVIASTLTTLVVFFPIVFVKGVAGQIFGDMALTVIIALAVSLILALYFIPMLLTRGESKVAAEDQGEWKFSIKSSLTCFSYFKLKVVDWWHKPLLKRLVSALVILSYQIIRLTLSLVFSITAVFYYYSLVVLRYLVLKSYRIIFKRLLQTSRGLGDQFRSAIKGMIGIYARFLGFLLPNPWIFLVVFTSFCALSYILFLPRLGGELIPAISQGTFNVDLTLPVGTPIEKTAAIVAPLEEAIIKLPGVRKVSNYIGGELVSAESSSRGSNNSTLTVLLDSGGDLERREEAVVDSIRAIAKDIPSLQMIITHPTLFSFKHPVELILKDNDLDKLRQKSREVVSLFTSQTYLADVESSIQSGYPEVVVRFDREKLARIGVPVRVAANIIKTSIQGSVPTKFREDERRVDIRVQLLESQRNKVEDLRKLVINPGQKVPVYIEDVADLRVQEGPFEIKRVGGVRSAVITADVIGLDLKTADSIIKQHLLDMGLLENYDFILAGQRREMEESLASLRFALLLAVFLVYVVMASQFESFKHPFLILITIPLAVSGVLPGLWLTSTSMSIMVFLGLIVLAGIVVNNSIVLVDFTNQLVKNGRPVREAVVEAAKARMRPILMTSLTTILALLPMTFGVGEGVEMRRPMALTVVFGLSFATLVSLLVIPLLYNLVTRNLPKKY